MSEASSPSILATELHTVDDATALAFVDEKLGLPETWPSKLIAYRLESEFQADWKAEIGHWLKTAERFGYLDAVLRRVERARSNAASASQRDPNDASYRVLASELAPAMLAHYLAGTKWEFAAWEPITGSDVDVDVRMRAPGGAVVEFQVKAPDVFGHVAGHRVVDGEFDERILAAIDNAAKQLPRTGANANMIAVIPNRTWPLAGDPHFVIGHLVGRTIGNQHGAVWLPRSRLGKFWTVEWAHVSGVLLLDLVRGANEASYACTVLLNPNATVMADESWFPRARMLAYHDDKFEWARGEPGDRRTLPSGTVIVEGD